MDNSIARLIRLQKIPTSTRVLSDLKLEGPPPYRCHNYIDYQHSQSLEISFFAKIMRM